MQYRSPRQAVTRQVTGCALLALTLMSGCATQSLPRAASFKPTSLAKRSIAVNVSEPPAFYADTTARRMFGFLGAFSMRSAGIDLVARHGLPDPSATVAHELKTALVANHGMVETAGAADLVLDVDTLNWDFRPFQGNANRMYVVYSGKARLIDARQGRIVAEGTCRSAREPLGNAATVDSLLADDARILRDELQKAGRDCARRLQSGALQVVTNRGNPVASLVTTRRNADH